MGKVKKERAKHKATIKVLNEIVKNSRDDIIEVGDKPFTGEVIIELIAKQGAMIATLADIIKDHLQEGK
ncbi:MAG: hypothetical protein GY714_20155 [Desulfobacterales bacterium]|nr:hypothetical protein [Desulfobacterales bacterium]